MMKFFREPDGTNTLRTFTSGGRIISDVECPVGCGRCCEGWEMVPELEPFLGSGLKRCPHLRARGCKLERKRRPLGCKAYLCELGFLAYNHDATQQEIEETISAQAQERAFAFLGRHPPAEDHPPEDFESHIGPEWRPYIRRAHGTR